MEKSNEKTDNVVFVYAKGEDEKVKIRIIDYVKIGFGFYVGYNLAQILKDSIKLNIKQK